jgi:hypothetical protein
VWCEDEHRLGLKPILGKVWAPKGQRPLAKVQHRYEWLYLYAFACPNTGESQYWILPEVSTQAFEVVLHSFANSIGASDEHPVLLVLDQAGWHTSKYLKLPVGLQLVFLPPYSPELQPAEHLWALTDAPLKNKHFDTLDHLHHTLAARCTKLEQHSALVRSHTLFHWWPSY